MTILNNEFNDNQIIQIKSAIRKEQKLKTFLMTKEYLKQQIKPKENINSIEIGNIIQIENKTLVFVPITNYNFYLLYTFKDYDFNEIDFVDCYPCINVSYSIYPENLDEILKLSKLQFADIIRKGELINKKIKSKNNVLRIIKNNKPEFYDDKVLSVLKYLKDNHEEIDKIINTADEKVLFITVYYNKNYGLSNLFLNSEMITLLKDQNFEIVFDIFAEGKST